MNFRLFLISCALFICAYFTYYFWCDSVYKSADLLIDNPTKRKELFDLIYNPILKQTHLKNNSGSCSNQSILLKIAEAYWQLGDIEMAKSTYERAMSELPNDLHLLTSYAHFLLFEQLDDSVAEQCLLKIIEFQPDHQHTNLLLADLLLRKFEHSRVRNLLNTHYMNRLNPLYRLSELSLYCGDYIRDLLPNLNPEQFASIQQICTKEASGLDTIRKALLNKFSTDNKYIYNELIYRHTAFEKALFDVLEEDERKIYLEDIALGLYGWQFWSLNYLTKPNKGQYKQMNKVLYDSFVKQKYCQLLKSAQRPMNSSDRSVKSWCSCGAEYIEEHLMDILTLEQFHAFKIYRDGNKWFLNNRL